MAELSTRRVFRPDPRTLDRPESHHHATFSATRPSPGSVVVTVEGEVDAANSRSFAGYVERHLTGSRRLIVDLRLVDFFGAAGYAALHNINVLCQGQGTSWSLRAGRQVRRLLQICDTEHMLPLEESDSLLDRVGAGHATTV